MALTIACAHARLVLAVCRYPCRAHRSFPHRTIHTQALSRTLSLSIACPARVITERKSRQNHPQPKPPTKDSGSWSCRESWGCVFVCVCLFVCVSGFRCSRDVFTRFFPRYPANCSPVMPVVLSGCCACVLAYLRYYYCTLSVCLVSAALLARERSTTCHGYLYSLWNDSKCLQNLRSLFLPALGCVLQAREGIFTLCARAQLSVE